MPLIKGGQGRTAGDVTSSSEHWCWCVLLAALLAFASMACSRPWKWNDKDIKRENKRANYHETHE